jgi:N-acetylneuraminic acid mutarotase
VSNQISAGTITLNGYHDLANDTVLNVNLLTTLSYQRIRNLVVGGTDFIAARAQAESEVLAAFGIRSATGFAPFGTLDIGANTDAGHALAAISSIFVQGRTSGEVNLLVARVQADIGANGSIVDASTRSSLVASAAALDAEAVAVNLNQKYSSLGVSFTAANIDDWLDRDGDGLAARFEYRVLRATSASSFALPTTLTNAYAGRQVGVSDGNLKVNGTVATAPVTIQTGDVITVTPDAGFANGLLVAYLQTGTTRIGKVTFAGHGTWSRTAPLATRRSGQTTTLLQNGKVIVIGGETGNCDLHECTERHMLASTEIYDPATDSWSAGASSTSPRGYHTVTLLANGKLLVAGGYAGDYAPLASAEIYDPATNSWTPAANMSTVRYQHAASRLANGKVLVTGGGTLTGWLASAEIYDAASNTWTPAASMAAPRGAQTSTLLLDGTVLVVGGSEGGLTRLGAERYDPISNTWAAEQAMTYRRFVGFTTTLLPSGKALVVGGVDVGDKTAVEIYDPLVPPPSVPPTLPNPSPDAAWSLVDSLSIARSFHSTTMLSDGRVLVAGGFSEAAYVASAEVYDPIANHWASTDSLETARSNHTATLLNDGSVLAVGGIAVTGAILASCELYW